MPTVDAGSLAVPMGSIQENKDRNPMPHSSHIALAARPKGCIQENKDRNMLPMQQ